MAQIRAVFTMTRRADPAVVWLMLAAFAGAVLLGLLIGVLIGHPIYVTVLGVIPHIDETSRIGSNYSRKKRRERPTSQQASRSSPAPRGPARCRCRCNRQAGLRGTPSSYWSRGP